MGKIVCAIEKCSRTRENQNNGSPSQRISFFSFPKEDELLDKWLDFVNRNNVNKLDKQTLDRKRLRLCHLHFQRKDLSVGRKRGLLYMRNSVPERLARAIKPKTKPTKPLPTANPKKSSPLPTPPIPPPAAAAKPATPTTPSSPSPGPAADEANKPPDSAPLYHSINGYVVDLRFASQLEMFRLPNGKLIQVRKQAKKPPAAAAPNPEVAAPTSEKEKSKENPTVVTEVVPDVSKTPAAAAPTPEVVTPTPEKEKSKENLKVTEVLPDVSKTPEVPVVPPAAKKRIERVAKMTATPKKSVLPRPEAEKRRNSTVNYKTYTNRRSQGVPVTTPVPRSPQTSTTVPVAVASMPISELPTPATVPIRPPNPMPQTQPQRPRRPIVAPCLTALQSLIYKSHDEITPFDLFQKQFENQLISTAEIGLHVVAKINNLINSNPFKTAETEQDLKYMYHHVGYILKYAIDRFTGLTETCASDIKDMGFKEKADLGPVFGAATKGSDPAAPVTTGTASPAAATPAEPEPKEADDEDCAIVEEQPDMIEIDSEDDDDQVDEPAPDKPTPTTNQPKAKPTSRPLLISSDTEGPEEDQRTSQSTRSNSESTQSADDEQQHQFVISEISETGGVIRQDTETTLKIANVIGQYYAEQSEEEEEEEELEEESGEAGKQAEPMEVDEQDKTVEPQELKEETEETTQEEEEETTELIEIIDGDDETDDPEYSVVECGDGDYYLVTTDGDEV